jgi:hypothetical protein
MCLALGVGMARTAVSAWLSGSAHMAPAISRRVLIAIGVVFVLAAVVLWGKFESKSQAQLDRLSAEERHALYRRTLADLELCATAGTSMADHCAHQADLILEFPECDAVCQKLAAPWETVPSR